MAQRGTDNSGQGTRAKVSAAHVADHALVQAQDVALGVVEPRGLLVAHDAHVVDGLDLWRVVVEEAYAATLEVLDLIGDVLDRKGQHGVSALRAWLGFHQADLRARPGLQEVVPASSPRSFRPSWSR